VNSDVISRTVERHNLEAERLLSNRLNQHQIAALQQRSSNPTFQLGTSITRGRADHSIDIFFSHDRMNFGLHELTRTILTYSQDQVESVSKTSRSRPLCLEIPEVTVSEKHRVPQ